MTADQPEQTESPPATVVGVPDQPPAWPPVRHPFQVSSFGVFLTLGAGWALSGSSAVLTGLVGTPWVYMWPPILVLAGICGFISAMYARRDEGLSLLTERVALVVVGGFCLVYTMAMLAETGLVSWVGELIFTFFLVACVWRYKQVRDRIKWCKRVGRTTQPRWRP